MSEPFVGRAMDRVDGRLKVTGQAKYSAEIDVAHVAHAVIVGSAVGRGTIAAIDRSAAEAATGVLAVLTHENAPRLPGAAKKSGPVDRVLQLLQDPRVLYSDQPVALVVADTLEHAQYAASLVVPRYDATRAESDIEGKDGEGFRSRPAPPESPTPIEATPTPRSRPPKS